ncbi:putative membrane protein YeaQ/YmgE (transglycosylase-associated protein family) [Bradyrhizobium sp. LB7.2]
MSRGMPSMTALLGMLAIAGYQNRDKLADMSRHATSGQPAGAKDSLSGMLGNLGGVGSLLHGGIGELLEHFKQNGQGRRGSILDQSRPKPRSHPARTPAGYRSGRSSKTSSRPACRSKRSSTDCLANFRQPWTNTRLMDVFRRNRRDNTTHNSRRDMSIIWTIIIGFIAGVIAKFIMPGDNEPSGFILTTILGIVGAFVATYLGQSLGWYRPGEGAGLVGAVVGAIIVLFVYGFVAGRSRRAI